MKIGANVILTAGTTVEWKWQCRGQVVPIYKTS